MAKAALSQVCDALHNISIVVSFPLLSNPFRYIFDINRTLVFCNVDVCCIAGKIDLLGAEAQAQQMGGAHHHSADTSTPRNPIATASATTGATAESEQGGYDINLFARGNVRIDTMSWIQIIRSKYGFEDNITGKAPAPGRTASANMNAAKVANSVLFNDKSA